MHYLEKEEKIRAELTDKFKFLSSFELKDVIHDETLGKELSFVSAENLFVRIKGIFSKLSKSDLNNSPARILENLLQYTNELIETLRQINVFNPKAHDKPFEVRDKYIEKLYNQYNDHYIDFLLMITPDKSLDENAQQLLGEMNMTVGLVSDIYEKTKQEMNEKKQIISELIDEMNQKKGMLQELVQSTEKYKSEFDVQRKNILEQTAVVVPKMLDDVSKKAEEKNEQFAEDLEILKRDAMSATQEIKELASTAGVAKQAGWFEREAAAHKNIAKYWLCGALLVAILTIVMGAYSYYYNPFRVEAGVVELAKQANISVEKMKEILQPSNFQLAALVFSKIVIFSALYYLLALCVKNYRAHRHNYIVNEHRNNALLTFESFVKASADTDTKNAVLLQATYSVFANQPSAYIAKEYERESPNKLVEIIRNVGAASIKKDG